jgi:hypothetical protein
LLFELELFVLPNAVNKSLKLDCNAAVVESVVVLDEVLELVSDDELLVLEDAVNCAIKSFNLLSKSPAPDGGTPPGGGGGGG